MRRNFVNGQNRHWVVAKQRGKALGERKTCLPRCFALAFPKSNTIGRMQYALCPTQFLPTKGNGGGGADETVR
ncbi:MAG: hypothetical protein KDE56_01920 [Anaerolineales bacterium]|nr:hypothetical protein [Anaerolineales bacterium]